MTTRKNPNDPRRRTDEETIRDPQPQRPEIEADDEEDPRRQETSPRLDEGEDEGESEGEGEDIEDGSQRRSSGGEGAPDPEHHRQAHEDQQHQDRGRQNPDDSARDPERTHSGRRTGNL